MPAPRPHRQRHLAAPLLEVPDEHGRDDGERRRHGEERPEPEAADHPLADERRQRRRDEPGDAVEAERPAAPGGRHEVDHVRVVRDEEAREAEPLEHADEDQRGDGRHGGGQERGRDHEPHAREHERLPAERVDPRPHDGLAQDADRVEEAHHDADVHRRAAEGVDVEGEQDEAVHAEEEKEVRDRRPEEGVVG